MTDQSVSVTSATQSDPIRVDPSQSDISILALVSISGTSTCTVEFTPDKPNTDPNDATLAADNWANCTWYDIADLTGVTSNSWAKVDTPVHGLRLDCTAYTNGTNTLQVLQGDAR